MVKSLACRQCVLIATGQDSVLLGLVVFVILFLFVGGFGFLFSLNHHFVFLQGLMMY